MINLYGMRQAAKMILEAILIWKYQSAYYTIQFYS